MQKRRIKLTAIRETKLPPVIEGYLTFEDENWWSIMAEDKLGYVIAKNEDYVITS